MERIGIVGRLVGTGASWSGIPAGLAQGLTDLGHRTLFVTAEPSARTNRLAQRWLGLSGRMDPSWAQTPEMMVLRDGLVRLRRLRRRSRWGIRHWIQMGSEFGHPLRSYVTFDDMTVAQAVAMADYVPMRPAVTAAWIRRQKAIYRRATRCCVASHWAAAGLQQYGIDPGKIVVAGFGCNIQVDVARRDWSTPRFLFVGLGWGRKNGGRVLDAFDRLREEHPAATLALVGDHPPIDRPGVTGYGPLRLDLASERQRLEELFRASTCLVVPSTYEPFGIVYAEAGWAGMPSIATAVGGAADAVGEGGIVVDPLDSRQLLRAMSMMSEPDLAGATGGAARKRAELLTWPRVARRVAAALGLVEDEPGLPEGHPFRI